MNIEITRYRSSSYDDGNPLFHDKKGDIVLWSDVESLVDKLDKANEEISNLKEKLKEKEGK